jgi:hypothetical protein
MVVIPALAVMIAVVSFNRLGDAWLDPRTPRPIRNRLPLLLIPTRNRLKFRIPKNG